MEPTKPTLLDKIVAHIAPVNGLRRQYARHAMAELSAYRAASISRLRSTWALGESLPDAEPWDRERIQERSRDANRNDPVASGALDTLRQNIVGTGLRPQSTLRGRTLGVDEERAKEIRTQVETAWEVFSPIADAANILSFDEIQFLAMTKIIEDGEIVAIPTWADEKWRPFGRCIELIEAGRLASPSLGGTDAANGIRFGDRGQPLAYYIRKKDVRTGRATSDFNVIPARDREGRPKIIHAYQVNRPGQTRGLPLFTPVLTYFKDLADYLEAEVVAARVAACLAVFVTKTDPMGLASAMGREVETSTGRRVQSIEPGMVGYLGPNEDIKVVDPKRPGDAFPAFIETMLRMIGVSIGLPYELIAKDFSKTNYSSARASLLEGRRVFKTWRNWFARRFCQPIWDLVMEEAYLRGMIDAPDFYENRAEYCRAAWIGGGWGWVDPTKEIEASKNAIDYGLSTHAEEVAGQGRDWEEVLEQRKREQDYIEQIGVKIGLAKGRVPEQGDNGDAGKNPEEKE